MKIIEINTESIKLDQVLKWANLVGSGAEAKHLIQSSQVLVNGKIETRRGIKVFPQDVITLGNNEFKVVFNDH